MKRTIYRVRKGFPAAGQFASASSWRRSKSHGGTRYVRQRIEIRPISPEEREKRALDALRRLQGEEEFVAEEEEEFEPFELEGSADYEEPE